MYVGNTFSLYKIVSEICFPIIQIYLVYVGNAFLLDKYVCDFSMCIFRE